MLGSVGDTTEDALQTLSGEPLYFKHIESKMSEMGRKWENAKTRDLKIF